jgi:hypothetical protein
MDNAKKKKVLHGLKGGHDRCPVYRKFAIIWLLIKERGEVLANTSTLK